MDRVICPDATFRQPTRKVASVNLNPATQTADYAEYTDKAPIGQEGLAMQSGGRCDGGAHEPGRGTDRFRDHVGRRAAFLSPGDAAGAVTIFATCRGSAVKTSQCH